MIVLLVRHARAGDRDAWEDDDRLRPLDKKGWKQAEGLVGLLADYPLRRGQRTAESCLPECAGSRASLPPGCCPWRSLAAYRARSSG